MRAIASGLAAGALVLAAPGCGSSGNTTGGNGATSTGGGQIQAVFSVTGSASHGSTARYGNDTTFYPGHIPLHTSLALDPRTGFVVLFVQLKNGGNVTCKVTVGDATSVGHAQGGHKTCLAKLTNRYDGTWYPTTH